VDYLVAAVDLRLNPQRQRRKLLLNRMLLLLGRVQMNGLSLLKLLKGKGSHDAGVCAGQAVSGCCSHRQGKKGLNLKRINLHLGVNNAAGVE
jgi:hypothetical protein